MGFARLSLYLIGLVAVVLAAWIFLTQTALRNSVPPGVGIAIILLLVGIGVMASARAMDDTFSYRKRVTHDAERAPASPYAPPQRSDSDTVVEERRF